MTKYDRKQRPDYQKIWAETFKKIGFASLFAGSGAAFSGIMGNFLGLKPWDVVVGAVLAIVLGLCFLALYIVRAARIDALIYRREHQSRYWDVQEFKISEEVNPNSPTWVSGRFASRTWDDANDLMSFLNKTHPEKILRVAPAQIAALQDRKPKELTALTESRTMENDGMTLEQLNLRVLYVVVVSVFIGSIVGGIGSYFIFDGSLKHILVGAFLTSVAAQIVSLVGAVIGRNRVVEKYNLK